MAEEGVNDEARKEVMKELEELRSEAELARMQQVWLSHVNDSAEEVLSGCGDLLEGLESKILQYREEAERVMLSVNRDRERKKRSKLQWQVLAAGIGALVAAAAVIYVCYAKRNK